MSSLAKDHTNTTSNRPHLPPAIEGKSPQPPVDMWTTRCREFSHIPANAARRQFPPSPKRVQNGNGESFVQHVRNQIGIVVVFVLTLRAKNLTRPVRENENTAGAVLWLP